MPRNGQPAGNGGNERLYDDEEIDAEDEGNEGDERQEGETEGSPEHDRRSQRTRQRTEGLDDEDDEQLPDDDEGEPPPRAQGRADRRIEALLLRQQELEDEVRTFRSRDTGGAPATPRGPVFESDQQFEARLANMAPDERLEARFQRSEQLNNARLAQVQMHSTMQADKVSYDAKAASDRRFKKYEREVEAELQKVLAGDPAKGIAPAFVPREILLQLIIGRKVLNMDHRQVEKERQRGQRNIDRQRTRPDNSRGDTSEGRRDRRRGETEQQARARRLENMKF